MGAICAAASWYTLPMKSNAAVARNDEDDIQSRIEQLRHVRDRVRRAPSADGRVDPLNIGTLAFEEVTSEDLHRRLAAEYQALGTSEQLVIRTVVADHRRLHRYQTSLDTILDEGKADVAVLERLEALCEKVSRSFFRGLDVLRLMKATATPIIVQAAARDSGRVDVRMVGGRDRSSRPRPIRLREARR